MMAGRGVWQVKQSKGWTDNNANMYERLGLDFNA